LPISSFASYQLAARGRSGNAWLSPQGMAVVSFALELTTAQAPKVVFVQYLAALAIAIALDPTGKLGVKIKWPNDVYAVVGEGKTAEKLKIGGILVSSVFTDGKFKVMPGRSLFLVLLP
jgi:biotin---protein ligase